MTLLNAIPPSNRRVIFARRLDSQLRFVSQAFAGLSLPSEPTSFLGERLLRRAMPVRWTQDRHSSQERLKCANQPPASMKENIRRGSVSG